MIIVDRISEMQALMRQYHREGKTIGFVPTMGYLHEGHAALIDRARQENDIVVLSVFVNPLQFGPNEDFARYPRDFERDRHIAEQHGVDVLFHPEAGEMYPGPLTVQVVVKARTDVLCGRSRPGHFDGVATVLTKLFHIVMPDRAYFGLKDAQQVAVVDGLIRDFNFPIELVPVPTVREADGLAKSSRNVYLSPQEREEAPALYQALRAAAAAVDGGERSADAIRRLVKEHIEAHTHAEIDYVEVCSYPDLAPLETLHGTVLVAVAVRFASARLIDNIILELPKAHRQED
ncbi:MULTISPECIES: pantoate--beta-alanine ligase [Geobacillus]|jgi:pantoate--beta-alanine ligase|uniref:Pantothenate synthetase n=2 Tax=Geobacillus thermodenitrificans TaxID=33940 RepID=PANC_GEOTN|nr:MULTISPECIES: pantoate--beta-alanine ligase [Geobacillus]A4IQ60.1 RecName: Full=Pantothenate synthetase; Short=PS; AltName: Full=Pantoate--beta-alanine ligase; AltName: Full=Pantoate-activating enzyme [Geobacillus thermodenitrificans NG80-2]ABO67464.1 Pantothenate synthetase [Geobacillus thermodenitrificans NG80-2]ARA99384.1 pantoate--beta-alanine ligase [Geobacillus thermodenitrificans]ARP43216.1 Pantothenate synthetase [Geobacillus thermodenitrificans]ATO38687.1 pantoate--beta-alanine lig